MPVDEQELVQTLLRDRSKFIAYIWSIVRDSHTAEDLFQEVSLIALRKRDEIDGPSQVMPWLRAVARNKARKFCITRSRRPVALNEGLLGDLEEVWARRDQTSSAAMSDALENCVDKLNSKARKIVALRYGMGLSGQEIADTVGVQVRSLYQAMSRIHIALASCVRQQLRHEAR